MVEARAILSEALSSHVSTGVCEQLAKCIAALQTWEASLQRRLDCCQAAHEDFQDLVKYSEQLCVEMEKSKRDAPVYQNAQEALKKSFSRLAKLLKDMDAHYAGVADDLAPPEKLEASLLAGDEAREMTQQHLAHCYQLFASHEFPEVERRSSRVKRSDQEKRRSSSPKRAVA